MPLVKSTLESELQSAFTEENWDDASSAIATAIDKYIKSATVTIVAGIPVATAGSPAAQTGATTGPGMGTIA